jgi:hypothetical protein
VDGKTFDSMTKGIATRLSRRRFLGLAGIGAVAALPIRIGQAKSLAQGDASALVQQFYELVDAYQYGQAYALLGSKWHSQQSQSNFTNGYSNTAFVQCKTTGETPSGSSTVVGVKLISWHNDGNVVAYTGSYTVGMENGTLLILAGNNKVTSVPSGTPPLCKIADVSFSFGAWNAGAGNRESSIVAKNKSSHTCVLGGSPRVTLVDQHGHTLVSTSEAGSVPEAVTLGTGDSAAAPLRFSNWCGDTTNPKSVKAELPGDLSATGSVSFSTYGISYPPCNGAGQAAVLDIKGFASS